MESEKQKLIKALIEKPSSYKIEILDNSMLPEELKEKEIISFEIKPPTLEVLALCTEPVLRIPEEIRDAKDLKIEDAFKYRNEMSEVLSILAHGKSTNYPIWYIPFFLKNLTAKELYMMFYESVLKMQTDFFLKSFQIANQNNPMMMKNPNLKDLTHMNL